MGLDRADAEVGLAGDLLVRVPERDQAQGLGSGCLLHRQVEEESEQMVEDDVLFGYCPQLFAEAQRTLVAGACRVFGVRRSTCYAWKRKLERHGLEMLRPRERRRPQMPNQLSRMVEERVLSFSIAHPGLGPKRVSRELARAKWSGIVISPNGVWRVLFRHGLNTRVKFRARRRLFKGR